MKNIRLALLGTSCAFALCGPAYAVQQNVVEVNAVDQVSTIDLSAYSAFHAASYHCSGITPCPADGGEGLFIKNGTSCTVDGGRVVKDGAGTPNCFYRQNVNGDIRQFGVVKGSDWDCSPGAGGVTACDSITDSSTDRLGALFAAVSAAGLHKVTLAGLQLRSDHGVTIPDGTEFDLGGASPFATTDGLLDIPGTLFLAHGATVDMGEQTSIHNGLLLADFYTGIPDDIPTQYHYRQQMVDNGDTGLRCLDAVGCTVHDMEVDGFDTGVEMRSAPHNTLTNVVVDGDVCFWASKTGGNVKWTSTSCMPKINRGNADEEVLPIDSIAEETTSGLYQGTCKVTLSSYSGDHIGDVEEGFLIWGRGATKNTGGTNINNRYHAHLTGTTGVIDLVGSACHGSDLQEKPTGATPVTGTWTVGDRQMVVSALDHIQLNDTISATGTAVDGLFVAGIWKDKNIIILSAAPVSGGSGTVKFLGNAYNDTLGHCDPDAPNEDMGVCLVLDAAARVDAGDSDGGQNTGDVSGPGTGAGNATGYLIGGPDPNHDEDKDADDSIAGFTATMLSSFGHSINFHVENANETRLYAPASDAEGLYNDPNTFFAKVDKDSNNASFIGGKGGKAGTGLYVKLQDSNECLNYVGASLSTTAQYGPQLDVESGCLIADGMRPGGGNAYIGHDASNVSFPGSYLLKTDFYYEDATARGNTSTLSARSDSAEQNNLINVNAAPAPAPIPGTDLQIVASDSLLGRVLQDSFGAATSFTGRRANGTDASPSTVADNDVLAAFEGAGYAGTNGYTSGIGGLSVQACETWTASSNCAAATLNATGKGKVLPQEVARAEVGGFGIGTGEGVTAPLEILNTAVSTTTSGSLTSGFTGSVTVGSTTGFPSPGVLIMENEAMAYTVTSSTTVNVSARGVWGTSASSHSAGTTVGFFTLLDGSSSSALPEFAATSLGNLWWSGHTVSTGTGTPPTASGNATGTGPTIAGNDNAGRLTVGTSPSGMNVIITFNQAWATAPVCFAADETTIGANPVFVSSVNKTAATFKTAITPTAGDKIAYSCIGYK